jgi:hypothetical protein
MVKDSQVRVSGVYFTFSMQRKSQNEKFLPYTRGIFSVVDYHFDEGLVCPVAIVF